jgi:hypothetical protein
LSKSATTAPIPALPLRNLRVAPQQQIAPSFPPHLCQRGGAPRTSRRFFAYNIRHSAALPVLPARQHGGKYREKLHHENLCIDIEKQKRRIII